jgi:hypothetical protein
MKLVGGPTRPEDQDVLGSLRLYIDDNGYANIRIPGTEDGLVIRQTRH